MNNINGKNQISNEWGIRLLKQIVNKIEAINL